MESLMTLPTFLAITSLLLIIIEIAIFGFGTLFLLFLALGCMLTAGLMYVGFVDQTLLSAAVSTGLLSLAAGAVLWLPVKKLQTSSQSLDDQPNVFAGVSFTLGSDLVKGHDSFHRYSGIDWKLVLDGEWEQLPAGTEVEVSKTAVGKLYVRPLK